MKTLLEGIAVASLLSSGIASAGMTFTFTNPVFEAGTETPQEYACEIVSPPMKWGGPPPGTTFFAFTDAPATKPGTWEHWVVQSPEGKRTLAEGAPRVCSSGNKVYRSFFKIKALGIIPTPDDKVKKPKLERLSSGPVRKESVSTEKFRR